MHKNACRTNLGRWGRSTLDYLGDTFNFTLYKVRLALIANALLPFCQAALPFALLAKCPHLLHAERGNVELPRVPAVDGAHDQGEQVGEAAMILLAGWLVPSRCVVRDPC